MQRSASSQPASADLVRWLTAEITKLEVEGLKVASVDVEGDCEVGMRKSKMCERAADSQG